MTNILFGIKHRQALDNVFSLANYLEIEKTPYLFNLICFFQLDVNDIERINTYNIEVHKLPNSFLIEEDEDKSKFFTFIKLIKFHKYLNNNLESQYKNDYLIISPGGFLLDQLCAFFLSKNIRSYILQSGYISIHDKRSFRTNKMNLLTNILSIFFDALKIRKLLLTEPTGPTYLTFNDEYTSFINGASDYKRKAITVGAPRFSYKKQKNFGSQVSGVIYIGSSALYEKKLELHEHSKLQIINLFKLLDPLNIQLSFRPHPRDAYDWKDYFSNYDISIISKTDNLLKQIENYKYVVSERSTVVLQAILVGKVGIWINKENSLLDNYEHINVKNENEFIKFIQSGKLDKLEYENLNLKQLTVIKKRIISYYGHESCKNVFDVLYKDTNEKK